MLFKIKAMLYDLTIEFVSFTGRTESFRLCSGPDHRMPQWLCSSVHGRTWIGWRWAQQLSGIAKVLYQSFFWLARKRSTVQVTGNGYDILAVQFAIWSPGELP
jgi:hypothetical protein